MTVPETITTAIRIEGKGVSNAERGTTQVKAFVDELGLKDYSTPLFVTIADAAQMEPGQTYLASLKRGVIKANKDGSYASHFFWDWLGVGDPNQVAAQHEAQAAVPAAPAPAGNPTLVTAGQQWVDGKNQSIERQVAAKAATEMYVAALANGLVPDWDKDFAQVLDRIQNGPLVAEVAPYDSEGNETQEATS